MRNVLLVVAMAILVMVLGGAGCWLLVANLAAKNKRIETLEGRVAELKKDTSKLQDLVKALTDDVAKFEAAAAGVHQQNEKDLKIAEDKSANLLEFIRTMAEDPSREVGRDDTYDERTLSSPNHPTERLSTEQKVMYTSAKYEVQEFQLRERGLREKCLCPED